MNNILFTHDLVKGKIAEIIFEQMIRNTKGYTILEFGYEKIIPELAQMKKTKETKETIEIVRRAPDFAVINHDTKEVHLIEVKYMNSIDKARVLRTARMIKNSWNQAALFVANPKGFYYDTVDNIIKNKGVISELHHKRISPKIQQQYLDMLNEFIVSK